MRVSIKDVENGWLVHYDVMEPGEFFEDRKVGEREKAFTYDFKNEKEDTWKRLVCFTAAKLLPWGELYKKIYTQAYDEEKKEWVDNEKYQKRREEKRNRERKEREKKAREKISEERAAKEKRKRKDYKR